MELVVDTAILVSGDIFYYQDMELEKQRLSEEELERVCPPATRDRNHTAPSGLHHAAPKTDMKIRLLWVIANDDLTNLAVILPLGGKALQTRKRLPASLSRVTLA